jgi:hypothetical protein
MTGSGPAPDLLRRVEELVCPLYAGLDGVQTFDRVERLRRHLAALAPSGAGDPELLALLLLLHGAVDRLGSLAAGGRLDLFLRGLGLPEERSRRVRQGLARLGSQAAPQGPEEELLHDAMLLDAAGVVAAAGRLMAAGRKRTPLARALAQLDPGPAPERYRTARGAALGAERRLAAEAWIGELAHKLSEEEVS